MSFLKKIRKKGRGKNQRELYFRVLAPSPTLECAKDNCLLNNEETTNEESRKLSRPGSLKNFLNDNRSRDITSSAPCSKVAATKANTAPSASLSDVLGDNEKKKEEKAHADTKDDGPEANSCQSNKTRSGPITVNRKAAHPPTSDMPAPSPPIPVRPPTPGRPRPARPPPPTIKQPSKNDATASNAVGKGTCSAKKKANEIFKYRKELNPFANCDSTTNNDFSSLNSDKAFSSSPQRHRGKQKESKIQEYPKADSECPPSDADEINEMSSSTRRKRRRRKRKESENEEHPIERNPSNGTDWGRSSSCSESTETSDKWSVSSLEDIQFVVNTAAMEEVNVKNALQRLAANNEKDAQANREDSGVSKAQLFPSGKEVSSVDFPSTKNDDDSANFGSTNVDASTSKDFKNVYERTILKQAKVSEEENAIEERQGGGDCASNACNRCPELVIYADAELQVVESELFSLLKVMVKLESEMKQAMDTEDCEAEFQSLSLDWLGLNKFRTELNKRKKDLFAL
ncbi:uncharacterized SDCCAG3 family protein-like [Stylophora pistillata]|uniref:uncharacterized SDCCAG3 family protein-like n=1 Tax=Stylophora pistillata TaxID=50429 RepID=UPI000C053601|nr:uncharacterized SDCCAG3 family protein-like [Stylophora pistillata]